MIEIATFPASPSTCRLSPLLLSALLTLPLAGCLASAASAPQPEPAVETAELAERTPDELLEAVEKDAARTEQIAAAVEAHSSEVARGRLREQIDLGLRAAEELLKRPDATDEQLQAAGEAKSALLYQGIRFNFDGFERRLAAFHEQLRDEQPDSPLLPVVEALLLEQQCLAPEAEFPQVIAALKQHAEQFPNRPTGLALYRVYAEHLKKQRRTAELKRCCETALATYGAGQPTLPFQQLLAELGADARKEQLQRARKKHIVAQLGGHRSGYFVLYSHPKKLAFMSPVDYHVAYGLRDAIAYVEAIRKDWQWELEGWFPDTKAGKSQAFALHEKLLDEKTISIPTFRSR